MIITLLKINDYISFRLSELRISRIEPLSIEDSSVRIKAEPKGVNLIFKGTPRASAARFYAAVRNLEIWHGSTEADFSFKKRAGFLIVKSCLWNIPLNWEWTIILKNKGLEWKGVLEVENCISIEEIKAGFIVDNLYRDITPSKDRATLIAKSSLSNVPNLNFKLIDSPYRCEAKIENLNCSESRILEIVIKDRLKFKSGKYSLFNLEFLID